MIKFLRSIMAEGVFLDNSLKMSILVETTLI